MSVFKGKIMQRKTCTGIKLATLLTVIAACQDNTVAPDPVTQEQRLTAEEAADIAEQAVDVIDWVLDGETDANPLIVPSDQSSDLALTMSRVPVTREFSWAREHECWGGGTFYARGAGTKTGDRDTGELTIEYEGGKGHNNCTRPRRAKDRDSQEAKVLVTIDGRGTFSGYRHKVKGRFEGIQTHDAAGAFDWVVNDDRSGSCTYELHVEWDPSPHTKTIKGHMCDRDIDRTVTRTERAGREEKRPPKGNSGR